MTDEMTGPGAHTTMQAGPALYGRVAYSWRGVLHVLDLSTGAVQALPLATGMWWPDWRSDGRFVALGFDRIILVDTERRVADVLENGGRFPNWSPDGSLLLYNHAQDGLVVHNPKTGEVRQVLPPQPWGAFQAEWFPDGEHIVFVGLRTPSAGGRAEKHLMRLPSACLNSGDCAGQVMQLTSTGTDNHAPSVSPDGQWIAYESFAADTNTWGIFVIPAAGGDPVRLTPPEINAHHPSWALGGTHLVIGVDEPPPAPSSNLYLLRTDGTELTRLTETGGSDPDWIAG